MKLMRRSISQALTAGLLLAALPALAQSQPQTKDPGPSFDFKLHGGVTAGTLRKDLVANQTFGFSLAGLLPLGGTRALVVELGFDYFPGRDHDALPNSGPVYYNYQNPTTSYQGQPLWLNPSNSIDWRKTYLQGFSLSCAYQDAIKGPWYWFAGVSLNDLKSVGQFSGTLYPSYGATPGTPAPGYEPVNASNPSGPVKDYYEGWATVTDRTRLGAGVLGGVGVKLNDDFKVEFRVRNIGFTNLDYRPFTYTGAAPVVEASTHRGFVFEFALGLSL